MLTPKFQSLFLEVFETGNLPDSMKEALIILLPNLVKIDFTYVNPTDPFPLLKFDVKMLSERLIVHFT